VPPYSSEQIRGVLAACMQIHGTAAQTA